MSPLRPRGEAKARAQHPCQPRKFKHFPLFHDYSGNILPSVPDSSPHLAPRGRSVSSSPSSPALPFDHFSPPKAPFPGQVDAIEPFLRSIRPFPGHNSYRLGTAANITKLKKTLTEKGLITKSVPMNYEISDPILSLWLKKECGRNRIKLYF